MHRNDHSSALIFTDHFYPIFMYLTNNDLQL